MTIDVQGAQGGSTTELYAPAAGGLGGRISASLTIASGTTLYIYPGGQPTAGSASGGWNGGGTPGYGTAGVSGQGGRAGGGGGASDIRTSTTLGSRIVVAGGGGGSGRDYVNGSCQPCGTGGAGGVGGGLTGGTGASAANGYTPGVGGNGGTQSAGGTGGASFNSGTSGSLGSGGTGSSGNQDVAGGGGGGGYYGGGGGSQPGDGNGGGGGGGGGGSSYFDSTYVSAATNSQGIRSGSGFVSITYPNGPSPTTFSTSQSSPTNVSTGTTINYSLVLSESVSDLTASDFQFGGTSTCNSPSLSGSGTTYTVSVSNCSEGSLILQLKANSVTGSLTGPSATSSANTVIIDRSTPTISSVGAAGPGTYFTGNTPGFTVTFSESITVTGTPRLTLAVGTTTKYATLFSMSDSKTALFRYTVGSDIAEFDTDGIVMTAALDPNGGSIADLASNSLTNLNFTAPSLTSVLIAQPAAAPTIDSISASSGQLSVYFTPGAARGSTTTNYQYSTNNGSTWTTRSPTATTSPLTITGLTNGTSYTIRLRAVTNAGNSDSSTAVTETPTAISVTGDATLTLTYGSSASTGAYSASGGTNTYTWSLGSSLTGITLSGTTVTASSSTPAGTYTQSVRATDGNSQVGAKTLTIVVNKAATSIAIALPNSATTAAASGTVIITATVSQPGSVTFKLGGTTISGCASQAAASTTATCSWTAPGSLGSVTLTADFTPTDSSNYETATTTNLTISIVNGVSTVTLSLAGGVTQAPKGQAIVITATIDQAGKVSFYVDGKRIPGCYNKSASAGNKTCTWKPATQKQVTITVTLNPTNNVYQSSSQSMKVWVVRRTGTR